MTLKCLVLILAVGLPALAQGESVAELKAEIERLKELNRDLAARLEGAAAPMNLARTSLAAVSASSVNGSRALDNAFYGVLNLFDDGENWHNKINYTYWLTNGDPRPWVEVHFAVPVSVASIEVEGGPGFTTRFFMAKGGEVDHPQASNQLKLESSLAGVSALRLSFATGERGGSVRVHEVRVLGHAPPGVEFSVGKPRVRMSRAHALASARERFDAWRQALLGAADQQVEQGENGAWTVVFLRGDQALFRVRIEPEGAVKVEPLVRLAPAPLAR